MLLSVYRTAFVLLDNFGLDPVEEEPEDFLLDEEIQRQNALILLTGDAGLSAPVTFECIKAKLLSIEREDSGAYGDVQDIRVSLLTAVRPYIAADRSMGPHTENISIDTKTATEWEWAYEIFQKIDDKGIAAVKEAASARS
ncbi:MAG: hypothetical protein ALECFALPRED_010005 [Alectoria fallacina]|uniref:Uncharacterized protein n=1 Tax=Alectoria fallacina TaxID=1903189 RepID=A0A8H3J8E8_9LECA|nr:MAG: hypothetical protein ALECFALPRED_010005 [Alectoria fallacina]